MRHINKNTIERTFFLSIDIMDALHYTLLPFFKIFKINVPSNKRPCYFPQMQNISDETLHYNPFELLDEDIVKAAPPDDEELDIMVNFLKFCRAFLFYVRRKSLKFYKRPL